ncbi:Por secretion system C-terminal sorting domain-containing protein [Flavobacterium fluvii]|uniref:Por secretion system C-terminal sorting domain-containing protein n=1 Tax=Flavobacterium fluvii TaxID=468056 RepID=A0A1M5LCF7_9FLAO|nr:T9SS type A sorting domain-containing protein [Flavobacterium fluvii]SHG62731.1 Por secretion system C-terminal sorting domain-containing protein [Flavobacterium fluvii]
MKKITLLFILFFALNVNAQVTDFVSGLNSPNRLLVSGTKLYVQGSSTIYVVDVTAPTPVASPIYTAPAHQYISNFTLSGTSLYFSFETFNAEETQQLACSISKIDVTNTGAGAVPVHSGTNYINALTVSGNTLYFASEVEISNNVNSTLNSFDLTASNPVPTPIISGFKVVEDLEVKNNIVYVSDRNNQKVYSVNLASPSLVTFVNALFNKGTFINNDELYITDGNQVKKGSLLGSAPISTQVVGQNSTSVNFRDVVLIGNKMYLSLQENGKIVTIEDTTLSSKEFASNTFSLLNNDAVLTLNGLDSKQKASVYNLLGQSIIETDLDASNNTLNITNLNSGVYVLKLNELGTSFKFLKK